MAAIRSTGKLGALPRGALLLWLAAALAACISLAVALGNLRQDGGITPPSLSAAEEAAARQERIAFFEQRAAADPLDFISLNFLAGEYLQRARETGDVSDYERADAAATRSLELVPGDNFTGYVHKASVSLVQHEYAQVVALSQRAQALKPANAAPYGLLADAQVGLGLYDEAYRTLDRMLELEAGMAAFSRKANLAFLRGDRLNAVDFWQKTIKASAGLPLENQAWARVQLGVTYFAFGDLSRAASQHERALQLFPDYVHALAGLGQVRAAQGRYDEAIDLYTRAVARQPQPQYVGALGDVLAAAGRGSEAEAQYALVEAIATLYRANGINTDLQIATFYADHEREPALALRMAREAYAAAPGVYAADTLAWALYRNGSYAEADTLARQAIAQGTPEASFYYHAALIRAALGDEQEAMELLNQVLDLNPRFSPLFADQARSLLAGLEKAR